LTVNLDVRLEPGPEVASAARQAVESVRSSVDPEVFDDLRLMLSELVTNSYRHAGLSPKDTIEIRLDVGNTALHAEVYDPGRFKRPPTRARLDGESGWGLRIVEKLAKRWGIRREGGTVVWFELSRRAGGPSRGPETVLARG
jgi:two-component sensor histidine kinase